MAGKVAHRTSAPVSVGDCEGVWIDAAEGEARRVILYLHGGAFVAESPHTHRALLAKLCIAARRRAASTCPTGWRQSIRIPRRRDDCLAAYRYLLGRGSAS